MKIKTCCITFVAFFAVASHAQAGGYVIEDVVNTDGPFVSFQAPSINDSGTIAFRARILSGVEAIFTASADTPVNTVRKFAETNDDPSPNHDVFIAFSDPVINYTGMVAATIQVDSVSNVHPFYVIVVGFYSPGVGTLLGQSVINDFNFVGVSAPSLTRDFTSAAFVASPNAGGRAIYATGVGVDLDRVEPIFESSGITPIGGVDRQGSGFAYLGEKNGIFSVYRDTTLIADETGAITREIGEPVTNNNLWVAFFAALDDGGRGVFMGRTSTPVNVLTTIADSAGPYFLFFPVVAINDANDVVFIALLDTGERGIFVGADPVADVVIKHGDSLFGSTVTDLTIGKYAFSNTNRIAFGYTLANGRSGLAIARYSNQSPLWDESTDGGGDGGGFPEISGFQTLNLPDAALVDGIAGELGDGSNGPNPDRDAYLITITDPAAFYATTSASVDPGAVTDASLNTRLWLFSLDGDVVLGNDDTAIDPVGVSHATITDPIGFAGLTGGAVDPSAATVSLTPGARGVLVVGVAPTDPKDAAENDLVSLGSGSADLFGPDSGAGPFDHWETSPTGAGLYTIKLRGAHFGFAASVVSPAAACMDVIVNTDSDCTATVTPQTVEDGSTVDPLCGPFTLHLDPSGPHALGDTQLTLRITDRCGQSDSCPAIITVVDGTDPMIDCSAVDPAHSADADQCSFTVPGAGFDPTFSDNCPNAAPSHNYASALSPDTLAGAIFPVGATTVGWTVTDGSSRTNHCSVDIVITDDQAPLLTCPDSIEVRPTSPTGAVVEFPLPVVHDNCDPLPSVVCDTPSGVMLTGGNSSTVRCDASDADGNTNSCNFTIRVQTVEEAVESVIDAVEDLVGTGALNNGQGNSLIQMLEAIIRHLERGRLTPACNMLGAFTNHVHGLIGALTPAEAQSLLDAAADIANAAGCND